LAHPAIASAGESLPGVAGAGARTVTPDPSAAAQDGAEVDCDALAVAPDELAPDELAVVELAVVELELPEEHPVSASIAAAPQASVAAVARVILLFSNMRPSVQFVC
jgi:hypothetical protein